jgi:hypothetical protein
MKDLQKNNKIFLIMSIYFNSLLFILLMINYNIKSICYNYINRGSCKSLILVAAGFSLRSGRNLSPQAIRRGGKVAATTCN